MNRLNDLASSRRISDLLGLRITLMPSTCRIAAVLRFVMNAMRWAPMSIPSALSHFVIAWRDALQISVASCTDTSSPRRNSEIT